MSTPKKPTWLEEVKPVMRLLRYSIPMERAYCDWIKRFVSHHAMGRREDVLRESTAKMDYARKQLTVRSGKGENDRVTTLPVSLIPLVKNHLRKSKRSINTMWRTGMARSLYPLLGNGNIDRQGANGVGTLCFLPAIWPSIRRGRVRRHHVDPSGINKAIMIAVRQAGLPKRISAHPLRQSFATHLLQHGTATRTIPAL